MIRSFADRDTEKVWRRECAKQVDPRIHKAANRKLHVLDAGTTLDVLRVPPEIRLEEALQGDRNGQHGIRINDQWRICFGWTDSGAEHVQIVDYH